MRGALDLHLAPDGATGLIFHDQDGKQRAALGVLPNNASGLSLFDKGGTHRAGLSIVPAGTPRLELFDAGGGRRANLALSADGLPALQLEDKGQPRAVLGAGSAGRVLTANLRRRLSEIDRRLAGLPAKSVLMIVWLDPLMSVGRSAFLDDALRRAGAHSVIDSPQSWPTIDLEQVVRQQPDYLIISNDDARQVQRELTELQERPGWRKLEAVRKRRFVVVSEAMSHPSPRLVDGIEQLARALYPEAFGVDAAFLGALPRNCRDITVAGFSRPFFSLWQPGGCL